MCKADSGGRTAVVKNSIKLGQKAATVDNRGESDQANKSGGLKQAGDSQKAGTCSRRE